MEMDVDNDDEKEKPKKVKRRIERKGHEKRKKANKTPLRWISTRTTERRPRGKDDGSVDILSHLFATDFVRARCTSKKWNAEQSHRIPNQFFGATNQSTTSREGPTTIDADLARATPFPNSPSIDNNTDIKDHPLSGQRPHGEPAQHRGARERALHRQPASSMPSSRPTSRTARCSGGRGGEKVNISRIIHRRANSTKSNRVSYSKGSN